MTHYLENNVTVQMMFVKDLTINSMAESTFLAGRRTFFVDKALWVLVYPCTKKGSGEVCNQKDRQPDFDLVSVHGLRTEPVR